MKIILLPIQVFYGTKLLIRRCRYHNINKKMRIKVEKSSCWLGNVWYGLHFLFFISFSNNGFSRAYMDFAFQVDLLQFILLLLLVSLSFIFVSLQELSNFHFSSLLRFHLCFGFGVSWHLNICFYYKFRMYMT